MLIEPGRVVMSTAGHDAGAFYMVVWSREGYVGLSDGRRRPLGNPKRKNVRHIRKTNKVLELSSIDTNKKLRRALLACQGDEGGNELV